VAVVTLTSRMRPPDSVGAGPDGAAPGRGMSPREPPGCGPLAGELSSGIVRSGPMTCQPEHVDVRRSDPNLRKATEP